MNPTNVDVAVIGASLAGLRAAWAAARAGASVILLEARPDITVPEPLAVVAFDHLMRSRAKPAANAVRQRVPGLRIRAPGGATLSLEHPGVILDRSRFDAALLREAEEAGVEIVLGCGAVRWERGDGPTSRSPAAELRRDLVSTSTGRWAPRVTVFADGARSQVRRLLPTMREPERVAWGVAHSVTAERGGDAWLDLRVGGHAPGGRTQWNPLGQDSWTHWSISGASPEEALARGRRNLAREANGTLRGEARFLGTAPDATYALPGRLTGDRILACGGAAAQGGVEVGLHSGEMAGEAAARTAMGAAAGRARTDALAQYAATWRRTYLGAYRQLRRAADLAEACSDAQLDRMLRPWDGRTVRLADVRRLGAGPPTRVAGVLRLALSRPGAVPPVVAALLRSGLARGGRALGAVETLQGKAPMESP